MEFDLMITLYKNKSKIILRQNYFIMQILELLERL